MSKPLQAYIGIDWGQGDSESIVTYLRADPQGHHQVISKEHYDALLLEEGNQMEDYKPISTLTYHHTDLISDHGHPLSLCNATPNWDQPILTVELYVKWYTLYLLKKEPKEFYPDVGHAWVRVYAIHYGHLEDFRPKGQSASVDHVPNPAAVRAFADAKGYRLDELADDLIEGRWQNEVISG